MELSELSIWAMAVVIFLLRILDVSLGTMRTVAVVKGRIRRSVVFGFLEVLIWVVALSQVVTNLSESPLLFLAYALGYAMGNATGILLERWMTRGTVMIRFLSSDAADEIAGLLHDHGQWAATFEGSGPKGVESIVFGTCPRPELRQVLAAARKLDTELVYHVEAMIESGRPARQDILPTTGWRGRFLRR